MTFAYHRSVAPMMWAFFALASIELVAVHFFLALKWPWIGWPLSIVSAATLVWLTSVIRSCKRLPHDLRAGMLTFRLGSLRTATLPMDEVMHVASTIDSAALKAKGTTNLAAIAYPNRIIVSHGATRRIAIRVDDPAAFDAAMRSKDLAVT